MLGLTERANEKLDAEEEMSSLTPLFSEREGTFDSIKNIDARLTAIAQEPGNEKLLENSEPVSLVEDLKTLVKRLMKEDEKCSGQIKSMQNSSRREFNKLNNSRKGIAGYAQSGKQVYAKFIDIKR